MEKPSSCVRLLLAVFLLLGCFATTQVRAGEPGRRNVYLIMKNLINPWCVMLQNGALWGAKDHNVNLTVLTPLQADSTEELTQLTEQAIASDECDVLILFTADSVGIVPAAQMVHDAGIPLIVLNTAVFSDEVLWESFVGCDNITLGHMMGEEMAKRMDAKGDIILLEGVAGSQIAMDRSKGIAEELTKYPDMRIVASQPANMNRAIAMDVMQNLLQTYPNVNGVLTHNDEMALGAIEAIHAAGKADQVRVGSAGTDPDGIAAIKEGRLLFSVDISGFDQGYEAVKASAMVLDGTPLPPVVEVEMTIWDNANAHEKTYRSAP